MSKLFSLLTVASIVGGFVIGFSTGFIATGIIGGFLLAFVFSIPVNEAK